MYQDNVATERHGLAIVSDYLKHKTGNKPIPITDKNQQKLIGDLVVATDRGTTSIEAKIEEKFTGNIFAEEWANREWGGVGWLHTCQAQAIVFYFRDADVLVGMNLASLKHWLLNQDDGVIDRYRQVRVKKSGPNDTHGRIIPIDDIRAARLDGYWEAQPNQFLSQQQTNNN